MGLMIDSLLPVLLLIALGAGLSAFKVVDGDAWLGIERLAYYVLFPALLIGTIARTSLPLDTVLRVGGTLIATALAIAALTFALKGWLMGRAGVGGPAFTSVFQGSVRWNTFSALAIAGGLYGGAGTAIVAIAVACLIPVVNVLAVWVLSTYAAGKPLKPGAFIVTLAKNRSSGPSRSGPRSSSWATRSRRSSIPPWTSWAGPRSASASSWSAAGCNCRA